MLPFDPTISPAKMIKTLGNQYVRALPLHDNDGWHDLHQVPMVMGGTLDWTATFQTLKDIRYSIDLVAETVISHEASLANLIKQPREQKEVLEHFRRFLLAK